MSTRTTQHLRISAPASLSRSIGLVPLASVLLLLEACAGHAATTRDARAALDQGSPQAAVESLNEILGVENTKDLPTELDPDDYLYVLDRSLVLQWLDDYELSSRDLEVADKGIEILDFSGSTLDDVGKFIFSDDSGPYQAPAFEKLMINTMNMMNYLGRSDLSGARVEARRLSVMQKFIAEHEDQGKSMSAPGSYLAGFIFEKSHEPGEALRYYNEALAISEFSSLIDPICRLSKQDSYRSPHINSILEQCSEGSETAADGQEAPGELLVIVNYGRVPAKYAKRIPIGLALTFAAMHMSPESRSKANYLAAQGLVTWINFPALGKPRGTYDTPTFSIDGSYIPLEGILAVDEAARSEWKAVQGKVIASAITRMITRVVAGETARRAAGGGMVGALLSLGTQATMTAVDTPDTRSWSTLPARIAFGRVTLPAGSHTVVLSARGGTKKQVLQLPAGGWGVVILTVLR